MDNPKIEPLGYVETIHSAEFLEFQEEVQKQIANITGVILSNCDRMRIDPFEQRRILFEDKVIKGLQKMLVDRLMVEYPKYIIKNPVDQGDELAQ